MSVMPILLIVSLLVAAGFLVAFVFSMKSGQFDDDISPAQRMLFENKTEQKNK